MPDHFTGHTDRALSRILTQMRGLPGFAVMVSSLTDELQLVEDALWSILTQCMLAAAVGAQLDQIGALVGYPRDSADDVVYRAELSAQILLLRGSGTPDQVLAMLQAFSAPFAGSVEALDELAAMVAAIEVFHASTDQAAKLARLVRSAKPVGVRVDLITSALTQDQVFKFAGGVSDPTHKGFATTANPATHGGALATATIC